MIEWIIERLAPQVDAIIINANRNHEHYARYGFPVVADAFGDFEGPLAGFAAAMAHAGSGTLLTVPCDSPAPPPDLAQRLSSALHENEPSWPWPTTASGCSRSMPCCRWRCSTACAPFWRPATARSISGTRATAWPQPISATIRDAFLNLNRPEDMERLQQIAVPHEHRIRQLPSSASAPTAVRARPRCCNKLLPLLRAEGLRIAVVKHAHHSFDMDYPGKDSYELRKSGADCCVVVSRKRVAVIEELPPGERRAAAGRRPAAIDPSRFDLILVEGFKHDPYPKIELHRPSLGRPLLHADDPSIIAVATDAPMTARPADPAARSQRSRGHSRLRPCPNGCGAGSGPSPRHRMTP